MPNLWGFWIDFRWFAYLQSALASTSENGSLNSPHFRNGHTAVNSAKNFGRQLKFWIAALLVILSPAVVLALMSLTSAVPEGLGVTDGRLTECPATPNCVSTQSTAELHAIAPLRFTGRGDQAAADLRQVIESIPRANVVTEAPDYLHVEFTSQFFRFVDDVEFLIDERSKSIHFRSASRVGYSDFGANRARMERIREAFTMASRGH